MRVVEHWLRAVLMMSCAGLSLETRTGRRRMMRGVGLVPQGCAHGWERMGSQEAPMLVIGVNCARRGMIAAVVAS